MKKTHTKANGYYKGECGYSKTGWAWWKKYDPNHVLEEGENPYYENPYYKGPSCTCIPCTPPKVTK